MQDFFDASLVILLYHITAYASRHEDGALTGVQHFTSVAISAILYNNTRSMRAVISRPRGHFTPSLAESV